MPDNINYQDFITHRVWSKDGKIHREDGPALECENGDKEWFYEGKIHRVGGPAVITKQLKCWYRHGKLHRLDGPAVEHTNGLKEWYIDGQNYKNKHDFDRAIESYSWRLGHFVINISEIKNRLKAIQQHSFCPPEIENILKELDLAVQNQLSDWKQYYEEEAFEVKS